MKHLFSLLVLSLVLFTACKKEEKPSIPGTWKVSSYSDVVEETANGVVTSTTTSTGENINVTYTFTENPNIVTLNGTMTVKTVEQPTGGPAVTTTDDATFTNIPATWARSGDTINVTLFETTPYFMTKFTIDRLELKNVEVYEDTILGVVTKETTTETIALDKQ